MLAVSNFKGRIAHSLEWLMPGNPSANARNAAPRVPPSWSWAAQSGWREPHEWRRPAIPRPTPATRQRGRLRPGPGRRDREGSAGGASSGHRLADADAAGGCLRPASGGTVAVEGAASSSSAVRLANAGDAARGRLRPGPGQRSVRSRASGVVRPSLGQRPQRVAAGESVLVLGGTVRSRTHRVASSGHRLANAPNTALAGASVLVLGSGGWRRAHEWRRPAIPGRPTTTQRRGVCSLLVLGGGR